jgi:hypothetical protein
MRKVFVIAMTALALSGCANSRRDYNAGSGALIGGGAGAIIGGVATNSVGGAVAGGLVGAAAGAVIGAAATTNDRCYIRKPSGRLRRVRCR